MNRSFNLHVLVLHRCEHFQRQKYIVCNTSIQTVLLFRSVTDHLESNNHWIFLHWRIYCYIYLLEGSGGCFVCAGGGFQLNLVNKFRVASSEPAALIAVYLVQPLCDGRGSPVKIPQRTCRVVRFAAMLSDPPRDAAGCGLQFSFAGFLWSAASTCWPCLGRGGSVSWVATSASPPMNVLLPPENRIYVKFRDISCLTIGSVVIGQFSESDGDAVIAEIMERQLLCFMTVNSE